MLRKEELLLRCAVVGGLRLARASAVIKHAASRRHGQSTTPSTTAPNAEDSAGKGERGTQMVRQDWNSWDGNLCDGKQTQRQNGTAKGGKHCKHRQPFGLH